MGKKWSKTLVHLSCIEHDSSASDECTVAGPLHYA